MATFKPEEMRAIEEGGNAVRPQRSCKSCARWLAACCAAVTCFVLTTHKPHAC